MWTVMIGLCFAAEEPSQAPPPVFEAASPLILTISKPHLRRHRLGVAANVLLASGVAVGAPMAFFFAFDDTDTGAAGSILSFFSFGVTLPCSLLLITALDRGPRLWLTEQTAPTRPWLIRAAWISFAAGWSSIALININAAMGIAVWTMGCVTSATLATASVVHNSMLLHSDTLTWSLTATPIKGGGLAGVNLRF